MIAGGWWLSQNHAFFTTCEAAGVIFEHGIRYGDFAGEGLFRCFNFTNSRRRPKWSYPRCSSLGSLTGVSQWAECTNKCQLEMSNCANERGLKNFIDVEQDTQHFTQHCVFLGFAFVVSSCRGYQLPASIRLQLPAASGRPRQQLDSGPKLLLLTGP